MHHQESVVPVGVTETVRGPPQSPSESQQDSSLPIQEPRSVLRSKRPFLNFFEDLCCLRLAVRSLKKEKRVAQRNGFGLNQDRTKAFCDFLVPRHLCSTVHFHDILFKTNEKPF